MSDTAVGVAGDWHWNVSHGLKVIEQFHGLGIKKIFQLGDFGLWGSLLKDRHDKFRWRIQQKLEKYDMLLFVTLGNHENYDLFEKFEPVTAGPWRGFIHEPKAPRILYFQRGQSLLLGDRSFLSIGGAASIDYRWRKLGESIWEQERITREDVRKTIEEAERLGSVDVILAHDVFSSAPIFGTHRQSPRWDAEEKAYAQTSRDALELVARAALPSLWLHGHYHLPITTVVELKGSKVKKLKGGRLETSSKKISTACLSKDGEKMSTGVLWLENLEFEYLPTVK